MNEEKRSRWSRWIEETRKPQVALPLALTLGFFLWGPEGAPWLLAKVAWTPAVTGMVSFAIGAAVMVLLPGLVLRFVCGEKLSDYGLGWGKPKEGLLFAIAAGALSVPVMYFVASQPAMQAEYPLYEPGDQLLAYEACYLLFFVAGEVSMRGYLLFGVKRWTKSTGMALMISTLVQTVWHLGKPLPELLSAPLWGLAVGALCLRFRSVWYVVVFHYVSNVALDLWILSR